MIEWVYPRAEGLYVAPLDAYVDPVRPVKRALITHGHADHARAGHETVYATSQTLDIMALRYGADFASNRYPIDYGQSVSFDNTEIEMASAGHVLGSAQIIITHQNQRLIAAGDYKRAFDPTVRPFDVRSCDVFITEATFGLPVFSHPSPIEEVNKLLNFCSLFPNRSCFIGAYALGKAQRVIKLLRLSGYETPIYLHGALLPLSHYYKSQGIELGTLLPLPEKPRGGANQELKGHIIMGPPSAIGSPWANRLPDPIICFASGWMQVKARAKQRSVEVPLILSDHADWQDILRTVCEIAPKEVWITHGNEEALLHEFAKRGQKARALSMVGFERMVGDEG
ncbi:MAG: ligase-associated DNA damage response exonuclease [Candidatus Puniceispirillaceae bacterium]